MTGRKCPHFHIGRLWVHARPAAGLVIATKPARFEVGGWIWLFHSFGFRFPFLCSAQGRHCPFDRPGDRKAGIPSLWRRATTEPRGRPSKAPNSPSGAVPSAASSVGVQRFLEHHSPRSIRAKATARSFTFVSLLVRGRPTGAGDPFVALFKDPPDKRFAFEARGADVLSFAPPGEPDDDN